MQTWLDSYVYRALDSWPDNLRPNLPEQSDLAAMRAIVQSAVRGQMPEDDNQMTLRAMHMAMLPFVMPPQDIMPARAMRISAPLVHDLSAATPPSVDAHLILLKSATWYIDIPHRSLLVDRYEIRALFVQPAPQGTVSVVAILTDPGSDKLAGRYSWLYRQPGSLLGMAATDVDTDYLQQSIDDLITLIMLYRLTADRAQISDVRRIDQRSYAALPLDKQRARQKTSSLFRVWDLSSPADRFGRFASERSNSWRLDHRVSVRGHFRWQPHGPRHSLRRLQWIDAHERGPGDHKQSIEIIHRSSNNNA